MELPLSYDQRARLELLAIQAGTSAAQLLMDTVHLLLERDAADAPAPAPAETQSFLSEIEFEARLSRLLQY